MLVGVATRFYFSKRRSDTLLKENGPLALNGFASRDGRISASLQSWVGSLVLLASSIQDLFASADSMQIVPHDGSQQLHFDTGIKNDPTRDCMILHVSLVVPRHRSSSD